SGNPLGMAAGLATLRELEAHPEIYSSLEQNTAALSDDLARHIAAKRYPARTAHIGSMMTVFFTDRKVRCWDDAATCNTAAFATFFHAMLAEGIHLPPAQYESWFFSAALGEADFGHIAEAAKRSLDTVFAA